MTPFAAGPPPGRDGQDRIDGGAGQSGHQRGHSGGQGRSGASRSPRLDRGRGRDRGRQSAGGGEGRRGPGPRPRTERPPDVDPARAAALELLSAVRERGAYANLALPAILADRRLSGRDAALATELGYGACRTLGQLDAIVAACGDTPLTELDGPILDALRLGAYQLLHTRIPPHAAVSATVDLVRAGSLPRASGYVNAVLRRVAERDLDGWVERLAPAASSDPLARLALRTAHPRWIAAAFADALGERGSDLADLTALLDADQAPPAVHLVARPGLIGRDALVAESGGEPGRYSPFAVYLAGGAPARLGSVRRGGAAVQDEGSQLVAVALAAARVDGSDARWLDLAAGPGGKAALLGALAAQRGAALDAVETAEHRADLVRKTTAGLPVTVHTADGRDPGLPLASFDRVLLDAPCTGLGALRRRPEARWRRTAADVAPLVKLQRELLDSAARLVRPGGVIAYVTCSPHLAETAGVVARRPQTLELLDAREYFPNVPDLGDSPTVQLWPHRHGTDAMFCALLRRVH